MRLHRSRVYAIVAPALLAALLTARVAYADSSDAAVAEALFQDAKRLMTLNKYTEACPKLEESYRLTKKLGTLLNLATCHDKEGKTGSAFGELMVAISLAKESGEPARVEFARKQLADLDKRLTKLEIDVPNPAPGAEVKLDSGALAAATWGTPLPVDPGPHHIEVAAAGYTAWSKDVVVDAAPTTTHLEVPALEKLPGTAPLPAAPVSPVLPPPVADKPQKVRVGQLAAGIVIAGVGVVGAAVGTYFGVVTFQKEGDSNDHCVGTRCDKTGVQLRHDASTSATVSTAAFAVGGGLFIAGGIVALTSVRWGADSKSGSAYFVPIVSPDVAGLVAAGRF
jgi:hypothetical protein